MTALPRWRRPAMEIGRMRRLVFSAGLLLVEGAALNAQGTASPVARIAVSPANPVVNAGDTLRLTAQALDAAGQPVPGAVVRFRAQGGRFEGTVDSLGFVESGATGTIPVAVVATVPGAAPKVSRVDVHMVPGPAAKLELSHTSARLALSQRIRVGAHV